MSPVKINRFCELFSSAVFEKLNEPVITVEWSIRMILLCAIVWRSSMRVGIPWLKKKSNSL